MTAKVLAMLIIAMSFVPGAFAQLEQSGANPSTGGQNIRLGRDSEVEKIERATKDRSHDNTATEATADKWLEYAESLNSNPTANANYRQQLVDKQVELLERALKVKERLFGTSSEKLVPILVSLGSAQCASRGFDGGAGTTRAEVNYKRAIAITETKLGKDNRSLIPILANYQGVLLQSKNYAAAEPLIRQYAALCSKYGYPLKSSYNYTDEQTLTTNKIAYCLLKQNKQLDEAEQLLNKALALSKKVTPPVELKKSFFHHALDAYERHADTPDAADALIGLAEIAKKRGNTADAEKFAKRAIVAYRLTQSMDNWSVLSRVEFRSLIQKVSKETYSSEPLSQDQLSKAAQLWVAGSF